MSSIHLNSFAIYSLPSPLSPVNSSPIKSVENEKVAQVFNVAIEKIPVINQEHQSSTLFSLKQKKDSEKYDSIFEGMMKNLNSFSQGNDGLTEYEMKVAIDTIDQYQCIAAELESITKLSNDRERDNRINALTHGGAEDGFSGIPIEMRIESFVAVYELVKDDRDKLRGFFRCFSLGDTCLNQKTECLNEYYASLLFPQADFSEDKALHVPAYVLSLFMSDDYFDSCNNMISAKQLKDFILGKFTGERHVNEIGREFERIDDTGEKSFTDFLNYLSRRGIYTEKNVNFRELALSFIESDAFVTAQRLAVEFLG